MPREFADVRHPLIPMHQVLRIDQVKKQGAARITELGSDIASFPGPIYTKRT